MASAMKAVRKLTVRYYAWDDSATWAKELIRRMRTSSALEANAKVDFSVTHLKAPALSSSQFVFADGSAMEFTAQQPVTEVIQSVYARAEDFLE
eukprot:m.235734 g.235734  ORF g.235734 m.235734 type:complete len:94 (+) comp20243_c0_seq1:304-585(+)